LIVVSLITEPPKDVAPEQASGGIGVGVGVGVSVGVGVFVGVGEGVGGGQGLPIS
jgi:hypothetical protein